VEQELVRLSKRLAKALRHNPAGVGLNLDAHGWVAVSDVLAALHMSREALDAAAADNDKQRFALTRTEIGAFVQRLAAVRGVASPMAPVSLSSRPMSVRSMRRWSGFAATLPEFPK
jgi:putative RNA 2'-phosphotransferase